MTTKITKIDKAACGVISKEAEIALQEVAQRFGLAVTIKGGKYDPSVGTYAPKIEFSVEGAQENDFAQSVKLLRSNWRKTWLTADDYNLEFELKGDTYKLIGIHLNRPKYPLECQNVNTGKSVLVTEDTLMRVLGRTNEVTA